MREHFPGPPFACDLCEWLSRANISPRFWLILWFAGDYRCDRIHLVLSHRLRHSDEKPFCCLECGFKCRTKPNLTQHQRSHSGHRPFTCEYIISYHLLILAFLQIKYGYGESDTWIFWPLAILGHLEEKNILGEACGRSFGMKSTLEQHLATHSSDRPYLCDTCGFSTKYLSHLIAHKRIHTGNCILPI